MADTQETSGNVMMLAQAQARIRELEVLNKALNNTVNKRGQELFNLEVELVQERELKEEFQKLYQATTEGQAAAMPPPEGLPGAPAPMPPVAPVPQGELKKLAPEPGSTETPPEVKPKPASKGIRKRPN